MSSDDLQRIMDTAINGDVPLEIRQDSVMSLFYMARAGILALSAVRQTSQSNKIQTLAHEQLQTLYGVLTERLVRVQILGKGIGEGETGWVLASNEQSQSYDVLLENGLVIGVYHQNARIIP